MANRTSNPARIGSRFFPTSWWSRLGLFALVWVVGGTTLSLLYSDVARAAPSNRPVQVPVAADHVSSASCRSCHPGNYASWHASFHRTMTQVVAPGTSATELDGLELTHAGLDYRIHQNEKKYFVRTKPHGAPATDLGPPQQITLSTGSHTLHVYWLETGDGRTLGQFPFAYIIAEKKWVLVKDTFLAPPGPQEIYGKGDWNSACLNCHTTQPRARLTPGTATFDTQVSEFGISCEACHGGGRDHIAANRNPLRRFALHLSGEPDTTIANPARMDGPTSSLVCGQCHSIWMFNTPTDQLAFMRDGGKFRAGQARLDLRWVAQPHGTDHPLERASLAQTDPHFFGDQFWGDGQVRVIGRELNGAMASPCFKGGKFSCLSCHQMHPSKTDAAALETWRTNDQMKPDMESNQACSQCHEKLKSNLTAHTHHAEESSGSSCYNCHMPHTIYGLLKATRSHQITSPTVRESTDHGRPNACNLCHLDQPLAWTAGKLSAWYGQKAPELDADDRAIAAGAKWILRGDAGQRALVALSMGWAPAQKAAGTDWLYPYLIFELNDPYAAVRFGAWKSLQTLPGFESHAFDYTIDDARQKNALDQAYRKWWFEVRNQKGGYRRETILESTGIFRQDVFDRLLDQRSKKKMTIVE
ncbi:MAG: C cytochrome precursor [Undibacterium sp.]|nr:C cytochrome precursor [Opitutaceae bacterium]